MTVFLWYVFGVAFFAFHLLNYMLVVSIYGEHTDLYKELTGTHYTSVQQSRK